MTPIYCLYYLLLFIFCTNEGESARNDKHVSFKLLKQQHVPNSFSKSDIKTLAGLTNISNMNEVLDNICIKRVVGTPGHNKVKQYIKNHLKELEWTVEEDIFEEHTPIFGNLEFENIIAKWNPNAKRFLTLACHYDSKYMKDEDFVGATDSAVPCMQLLNLATVMQNQLDTIKENDVSLMLLFLDGEEAFLNWSPRDSIYGARNLAAKWEKTRYRYGSEHISDLDKIDLFVLLDLIGAPDPKFYSFFKETSKWHSRMSEIENVLANLREFKGYSYGIPQQKYFQPYTINSGIEDDHIPFLNRKVPVLHLIPYPFPDFWHTSDDNRNNISISTIENINKIIRVFVAEYLHMEII